MADLSKPETAQTVWNWFECRDCGFDSDEAGKLSTTSRGICPLCAGDNGRDVWMSFRTATSEEIEKLRP